MTMNRLFGRLRKYNRGNYIQLLFCVTLSITLITAYSVMLYNPVIQNTLPVGGDSRKQVYMIFVLAAIGCLIFAVYASGLFFRYKSRETGVFLALGTKKSRLSRTLINELALILSFCTIVSMVLGGLLSFLIWQLFRSLLIDDSRMIYQFSATGYGIGLLFALAVCACIIFMGIRFMKKTNLMDVINAGRKSEPLRKVSGKTPLISVVLIVVGLLLGYVVPSIAANSFNRLMPGIWNVTYLIALVGVYMLLEYSIVYHKKGRNPQKYYKNIISHNMMKFQGRQTVRNMAIITLLIACSLFASFYVPQTYSGVLNYQNSPVDYALAYPMNVDEVDEESIYQLADKHGVTITDYRETVFAQLLGNSVDRDWSDDGELIEDYYPQYNYYEFISESEFNQATGLNINVGQGSYYYLLAAEEQEGFWYKFDDLDLITSPATGEEMSVSFADAIEYQPFVRNGINRYVLSDEDYARITAGLENKRLIRQILFNVTDSDASYPFAKALYQEFIDRSTPEMAVVESYDEQEEALALAQGESYHYSQENMPLDLSPDNTDLLSYWKYYPTFRIMVQNTYFESFAIFFLLFVFVSIICYAAVGVISYTRSITIGMHNKQVFDDLKRLGANNRYLTKIIRRQLNKIFSLPTIIAAVVMLAFSLLIFIGNDGFLSLSDKWALKIQLLITLATFVYQYAVYRFSLYKIRQILEIKN